MRKLYLIVAIVFGFIFSTQSQNETAKTDVWDFGAYQLSTVDFNNMLDVATINSWYPSSITPGSSGQTFPSSFTSGILSWTSTSATSDRLRTSNTELTRYDANGVPVAWGVQSLTGYLYVNSSGATGRFLSLNLNEDDEVSILAKSQNGTGMLTFEFVGESGQKDVQALSNTVGAYNFVAKKAGVYKIYDTVDKPFYYRIYRKPATYLTVSGTVDISGASEIPTGYALSFTNEAGKVWTDTPDNAHYFSIQLPAEKKYKISLENANGYIISENDQFTLNENITINPVVKKVSLFTLSGYLKGTDLSDYSNVKLIFTPKSTSDIVANATIEPATGHYSVQLEPGIEYAISAIGLNDYTQISKSIAIHSDFTIDLYFSQKPVYKVTLTTNIIPEIEPKITAIFTNLNEPGYTYTFSDINEIRLRNGVYSLALSGLDEYSLQLGLTSNVVVKDNNTTKSIVLVPVTVWSFDDKVINASTPAYKGLFFSGSPYNEQAKGHLVLKNEDTVRVPLIPGQKMVVTYYYSANFKVDGGDAVTTSSGSTNQLETKEFVYEGTTSGYMTISNAGGTTYITEIKVIRFFPYEKELYVGQDKNFLSINTALQAVRSMNRSENDTVKIMIDPGNYEEMLVIDVPNVSLINASQTPDIALLNKGVDISPNAVRITSYYGHGYNYFSMEPDQKWSADHLRVNKENGYTNYNNTGSGTGNNSYWNATVVVTAPGFTAENIIFENSFNQYISKKEAQDVVVEWTSGGKGVRPTDVGNTQVQNKSFVERASAIAYAKGGDRSILYNCRLIGRQDTFFGAEGARVVSYKGALMGGTDYIFGGMTLVAYKTDLAMNTSEASTDVAYITASQQSSSRGFLFYECNVTSANPGTETATACRSKPGYFGRPWLANTSEVVFYNTQIQTSNNPNFSGQSLILPIGWNSSLGGTSDKVYEFGTTEISGTDNSSARASWSHVLTEPKLTDGTEISTFNFTKGTDNWDPIPMLLAKDNATGLRDTKQSNAHIYSHGNDIFISNIDEKTQIEVFGLDGKRILTKKIVNDTSFQLKNGIWIARAISNQGIKTAKLIIR